MASVKSREEQEDDPPMSRLFIICNKTNTEEEFRDSFSKFGTIEEIWIVKDKLTGEHKGQSVIKQLLRNSLPFSDSCHSPFVSLEDDDVMMMTKLMIIN